MRLDAPDLGPESHSLAVTASSLSGDLLMHFALNAWRQPLDFELPPLPADWLAGTPWTAAALDEESAIWRQIGREFVLERGKGKKGG